MGIMRGASTRGGVPEMIVERGHVVRLHYELTDPTGARLGSSREGEPHAILFGHGGGAPGNRTGPRRAAGRRPVPARAPARGGVRPSRAGLGAAHLEEARPRPQAPHARHGGVRENPKRAAPGNRAQGRIERGGHRHEPSPRRRHGARRRGDRRHPARRPRRDRARTRAPRPRRRALNRPPASPPALAPATALAPGTASGVAIPTAGAPGG